jgi:pyruvate/2-oxoglutarate dehydrogenase complex dihydrolipoamide acyltransferase (E2) component
MSSSQSNVLVLASAEGAAAAQPGVAEQTVATTQAPAKKGAFSENPSMGEIIEFQATGLLVVFVVLGAITCISMFMSWCLKTFLPSQYYGKAMPAAAKAAPAPAPKPAAAPAAKAPVAASGGLSQEKILVLLTAAAHEVLGSSASVVSFRPAGSSDALWSIHGRAAHHSSHKL